MKCKICTSISQRAFSAKMLEKYEIQYYLCGTCGFLQTETPYWLEESYGSAISAFDTGLIARNIGLSKKVSALVYFLFDHKASFLDYAGGYGVFTRLMRDAGFDFYWHDPYSQNLVARGFEYDGTAEIDLITTFESFEHFTDPLAELEKMMAISGNILFSTELLPTPVPPPGSWWYYGFEHGQHVSFYSRETLRYLAAKLGVSVYSYGSTLHLFTSRKINPKAFYFVMKFRKILLGYVSRSMKSKTLDDMHYLQSRMLN